MIGMKLKSRFVKTIRQPWAIVGLALLLGLVVWTGWRVSVNANADRLYQTGVELYQAGDVAGAQAKYLAAVKVDSAHASAWNNLGNIYRAQGENDLARSAYQSAIMADPRLERAYRNLSFIYLFFWDDYQAQSAELETILLDGLVANPNSLIIREELVKLYGKTGQTDLRDQYQAERDELKALSS